MIGRRPARPRAARAAAPAGHRSPTAAALVLLGVAALVAVALARGRPGAPVGSTQFDVGMALDGLEAGLRILSFVLVVAVAGMLVAAVVTRAAPRPEPTWRLARRAVRFVLVVYAVAIATAVLVPRWRGSASTSAGGPPADGVALPGQPGGVVWPLALVAACVAVALYGLWRLRDTEDAFPAAAGREAARALQAAVDRLDAGEAATDVVVRAYLRMERLFARAGVPRQATETPGEYLARALNSLDVDPAAPGQLAALYERARFGPYPIGAHGRRAARAALARLARELADV